jgi:hypothetical protein
MRLRRKHWDAAALLAGLAALATAVGALSQMF